MIKRKLKINKKNKDWKARYPLVEVHWLDIASDASWSSLDHLKAMELPVCVSKGHLFSQAKGVTRLFGDYALTPDNEIDEVGNVTIIPNSVIKSIEKI